MLKIQSPFTHVELPDASPAEAARRPSSRPAAGAPAGSAEVALSPLSTSLKEAGGDVDMERVEAIRNAIRSGELQIDASRIADGLLESVRELIQR